MILNLGAGNRIVKDAINHDRMKHRKEIDVTWDLNQLPWPWKDGEFKEVHADSVFEHLDIDMVQLMDECWRILEPGGKVTVKVPAAEAGISCWGDPTHRRPYCKNSFDLFDPKRDREGNDFYTTRKWKLYEIEGAGKENKKGAWTSWRFKLAKRG